MFRCVCTNSVFLTCDDEPKGYKPIITSGPRPYNPKVKIHGWEENFLSQPHDNKKKCSKESTYKRFGSDDAPTGISVTRAMTEQIHTKADCAEEYRRRRLLNIYSFPYTQTKEYKEALEMMSDLKQPKPVERTDYRTTLKDDFPWHYPEKALPPLLPHHVTPAPWLMYRRTLGYSSHDLERRPGIQHFLDDNMDIQNRISMLKMQRFTS